MISAKVRGDSWAAQLSPAQMWAIYDFHYNPDRAAGKWDVTCEWATKEFELPRRPGRQAFYNWLQEMHKLAPAHRREVRETSDEIADESAKSFSIDDQRMIAFIKSRALDYATLAKDSKEAQRFMNMADALIRAGQRDAELKIKSSELELKKAAQQTKDEQLKLAREKFEAAEKRLKAVQDAVKSAKATGGGLSEETLKKIEEAAGLL